MGMYTELYLRCRLKEDTPSEVIDTLKYMLDLTVDENKPTPIPQPPFDGQRWDYMLQQSSYYLHPESFQSLIETDYQYYLCVRCDFKNYDNELTKFLVWLTPYIEAGEGEYLGHYQYEESEFPTFITKGLWR